MREHMRRWGAAWILLAMFTGSWAGQLAAQLQVARADAAEHGQPFAWPNFWAQFLASTLENWQSEFLQLLWQAILVLALGRYLFRADNTASTDDVADLRADIASLRRYLDGHDD